MARRFVHVGDLRVAIAVGVMQADAAPVGAAYQLPPFFCEVLDHASLRLRERLGAEIVAAVSAREAAVLLGEVLREHAEFRRWCQERLDGEAVLQNARAHLEALWRSEDARAPRRGLLRRLFGLAPRLGEDRT